MCGSKLEGGMGFRSFICFNQALLTKHARHFINHYELLLCQIYKARYFSHNNFLNAHLGHNPSLT